MKKCNIAYEPIWAIGSGNVASDGDIREMHGAIRTFLEDCIGKSFAKEISLLYGGSVSAENVGSIIKQDNVDGVLVGGASVSMETFGKLLKKIS